MLRARSKQDDGKSKPAKSNPDRRLTTEKNGSGSGFPSLRYATSPASYKGVSIPPDLRETEQIYAYMHLELYRHEEFSNKLVDAM